MTQLPRGVLKDDYALALLGAGLALSLLIGTLMFVLGTGRARARRVVHEQTRELRHQALHDALTGLPNRALIMDRIDQLLARSRRQGTSGAALYVDLDEFKNVNDTLGHGMGDRLLVAVANRLRSTLRDADTIGRMGGDEFVVLIDGASLNPAPEMVADRILDVMRQPFVLEGATMPLIVNTTIGIAIGDRPNPEDLLRDADVALYQAKAAGKNRYEIFDSEMRTEIQHRLKMSSICARLSPTISSTWSTSLFTTSPTSPSSAPRLCSAGSTRRGASSYPASSSPSSNRPARSDKSDNGCSAKPAPRWPSGMAEVTPSTSRSTCRGASLMTMPSSGT